MLESFDGMADGDNYNEYIVDHIYGDLVGRIVDHFITMRTIDDLNLGEILPDNMGLNVLVENLINVIAYELYPDGYPASPRTNSPPTSWITSNRGRHRSSSA